MDISKAQNARRDMLYLLENPDPGHDYLCEIRRQLLIHRPSEHKITIIIRYVPDNYLLSTFELDDYFDTLAKMEWHSLELLALTALEDINNQAIPRWVQVSAAFKAHRPDRISSEATVEDHQPNWNNPHLLNRIYLLGPQLNHDV